MSWPIVGLGEICMPKQWPTLSKADMSETGYPVFGANGQIGFYERFTHESPTILVGCRGSCGTVHVTPPFAYANGNAMALDELNTKRVDINFLKFFLLARGFKDVVSGSSQPQIIQRNIVRIQIPLPPVGEQKRIAAILDQADALRRLRQRAIARLRELGQAIFYEMFGDPARNERGWEIAAIDDFGSIDRGISKHRPRNDPQLLGGSHPLIQTGDVSRAEDYILEHKSTYSDIGLNQSKMWPEGTLCITIAANIADTAILSFDSCFPDSVVGFLSDDPDITLFIHNWFKIVKNSIESVAPAVAQKNINLRILRDLKVISPPSPLIRTFAGKIREIGTNQKLQLASCKQLDSLFASLQQRAFRGEV